MATQYGSGIKLTQDLDFEINSTGDIATEIGVDELEKDLAFNMIAQLSDIPGRQKTPRTIAVVKSRTEQQLLADPRVRDVIGEIEVFYPDDMGDTIEVAATVNTVDGEQQLVFPVGVRG
jgi:hypothetical protein